MAIRNPREPRTAAVDKPRRRMFPASANVERVIAVETDAAGERIVITEVGRSRIRYIGVVATVRVGDKLELPLQSRARQYDLAWSPFDAPGDVDDDKQKGRVF